MQFKHPELLWALFLLLIPIFIHLFQLRKFQKSPFTNVKLLKKVVIESRKSNTLKKWLLLVTRLLLLAALVTAFAQPFFAKNQALKEKENIIYLDDSFSMQLKKDGITLLQNAVQDFIKSAPKDQRLTLFTNTRTFKDVRVQDIQNELLSLEHNFKQLTLKEVELKAQTLFSADDQTDKNLILVSDFQNALGEIPTDSSQQIQRHWVQLTGGGDNNVSIDSVFLEKTEGDYLNLSVKLTSQNQLDNIPVSLYNDSTLTAKSSASFNEQNQGAITFTIPKGEQYNGKIELVDTGLNYDNKFFFNLEEREQIKVLTVSEEESGFLGRIFTSDEFLYASALLKNLNYSEIEEQNLIILNELKEITSTLATSLRAFAASGGHITIIPAAETDNSSYNLFLSQLSNITIGPKLESEKKITSISFNHPLFANVFEKNITNFQYPNTRFHYKIQSSLPSALAYQDQTPFLVGDDAIYVFSSPLSKDYSNFKNSPLIVPTFYKMGSNSLKIPHLYYMLGDENSLDVTIALRKDGILKLAKKGLEFIPPQQSLSNKVRLTFNDHLTEDGVFNILDNGKTVGHASFNFNRNESRLNYLQLEEKENIKTYSSLAELFVSLEKDNRVTELWKWFVILALLFLMVEILIQKFLK
ncbi:BatA domain-containing protein [Cytophaga sp. FL35]|uniref:BatA domain-containing protein n=1 Tax=Cytophaga sp. FL35 TaxID=1904456 RepID=UPI001653A888|nr:BatA domain-containing protein [Cytophaga sp. FL35]MBC6999268.1 BatA domain-containing protein [Cytophaga sp. FL35]